jgi:hypothetical protein
LGIRISKIIDMENLQDILRKMQSSEVATLSNRQIGGLTTSFNNLNKISSCPNCGTVGKHGGMKSVHFKNCVRPKGYSNQVILDKYSKGVSPNEISKECGISATSVRRVLQRNGEDPIDKWVTNRNDLYEKIIDLKKKGYTNIKIQKELNTSNGSVCRAVKKYKESLAV